MVQNENGILGIIRKNLIINTNIYYKLNLNLEISIIYNSPPTVQATESNYKRVHGGKKPNF